MASDMTVKPACLDFLTIFNPAFGIDEASQRDQILFYYSAAGESVEEERITVLDQDDLQEKQNERLRQVGLAQGLIAFARYIYHLPGQVYMSSSLA